ncbi:PaaX family transcriptional regulator C-terminal domain-containing protein, partial [Nocardioides sp.]|uniref:PaaX family transcriptional regulator C-terminal domain-containing protein n=1 Tax=Nocardioides sp. TaxID=35761 RepID=UPI002735FE1F
DPAALAARLWDLSAWSRRAQTLMDAMGTITAPPARLATAAEMVRHLATDPILPPALVPADWPGEQLRAVYAAYQLELRALGSSDGE